MPTPFTGPERDSIRSQLMDAARHHFAEDGLKKTSLVTLTDAAGIAKSTFYAFFDSKEELCLALLQELAPEIEDRVLKPALHSDVTPQAAIRQVLRAFIVELRTQPLLRRLLAHPDDLRSIAERVGPDELAAKARALAPLQDFVEQAQKKGELRQDLPPEVILGALRAVTLLELQSDLLAPHQEAVIDLMVDLVASGLVRSGHA